MVRDKNDPPGLREQVIGLFEEWLRVLAASPDDKAVTTYLHSLKAAGESLREWMPCVVRGSRIAPVSRAGEGRGEPALFRLQGGLAAVSHAVCCMGQFVLKC